MPNDERIRRCIRNVRTAFKNARDTIDAGGFDPLNAYARESAADARFDAKIATAQKKLEQLAAPTETCSAVADLATAYHAWRDAHVVDDRGPGGMAAGMTRSEVRVADASAEIERALCALEDMEEDASAPQTCDAAGHVEAPADNAAGAAPGSTDLPDGKRQREHVRSAREHNRELRESSTPPTPPATDGEWSAPMSKAEMARRLIGKPHARGRDVESILKRYGLKQLDSRKYIVRLDTMDSYTRRKLDKPA